MSKHRKNRPLRPTGQHRAVLGTGGRWIVPAGLAVAILVVIVLLLLLTDATI